MAATLAGPVDQAAAAYTAQVQAGTLRMTGDDASDTLEGQDGADRLDFNGNGAPESIDVAANGGRVRLFRNRHHPRHRRVERGRHHSARAGSRRGAA